MKRKILALGLVALMVGCGSSEGNSTELAAENARLQSEIAHNDEEANAALLVDTSSTDNRLDGRCTNRNGYFFEFVGNRFIYTHHDGWFGGSGTFSVLGEQIEFIVEEAGGGRLFSGVGNVEVYPFSRTDNTTSIEGHRFER